MNRPIHGPNTGTWKNEAILYTSFTRVSQLWSAINIPKMTFTTRTAHTLALSLVSIAAAMAQGNDNCALAVAVAVNAYPEQHPKE